MLQRFRHDALKYFALAADGRSMLAVMTDVLYCCGFTSAAAKNGGFFVIERLLGELGGLAMGVRTVFLDGVRRVGVCHMALVLADF